MNKPIQKIIYLETENILCDMSVNCELLFTKQQIQNKKVYIIFVESMLNQKVFLIFSIGVVIFTVSSFVFEFGSKMCKYYD